MRTVYLLQRNFMQQFHCADYRQRVAGLPTEKARLPMYFRCTVK